MAVQDMVTSPRAFGDPALGGVTQNVIIGYLVCILHPKPGALDYLGREIPYILSIYLLD